MSYDQFVNMSAKGELKKKTCSRKFWTSGEENLILDLWEEKIDELRGARKNSHVYQEMVAKVLEAGFEGSWVDVRTKLDNLTRKYKEERKKIGPKVERRIPGSTTARCTIYWAPPEQLVRMRLCTKAQMDMSSLDDMIEVDVASCSRLHDADGPPRKKKKADVNEELLMLAREKHDMQKERRAMQKELLEKLDIIAPQNASFQKELLEILKNKN